MKLPPAITFRGIEPSPALEADIRRRIAKLETYYRDIMGCRVLVEFGERHHHQGNRFHVRIDVTVPSGEVVVAHEPSLRRTARTLHATRIPRVAEAVPGRKDAHLAVREAFDIARRRIEDYARRQRGVVKTPSVQARGRVARLMPVDGCGYVEAADGHEIYFQKSSVLSGDFDRLSVGSAVSYVEERGDKGPQASTVKLLHRRAARRAGAPRTATAAAQ
jgi:cold shock CspA family protein